MNDHLISLNNNLYKLNEEESNDSLQQLFNMNNISKNVDTNLTISNNIINIQKESKEVDKKRHRREKKDEDSRNFKCQECQKSYFSASALKEHRKRKHNNNNDLDKKGRGRPKKELLENDNLNIMKDKYDKFWEDAENKKKNIEEIKLSFITDIFNDLYSKYKKELFDLIDDIEKYTFYKFVINNLEIEKPNLERKSYFSMINCPKADSLVDKPSIDEVFFLYIKYLYNKINKDYFSFALKYIIIFRKYINMEKKDAINKKFLTEQKKEYTQIYDAEIIPDLLNDFLIEFMEQYNYFSLDKEKIIEIIEYFCFWLYLEGYTNSHISKL